MVDAQAVQQGRVQVVDVHRIAGDVVAEVVRLAVSDSSTDAATREPHAVAPRMMVAAEIVGRERALAEDGPAELPGPDHQGVFEEAALPQVGDEGR